MGQISKNWGGVSRHGRVSLVDCTLASQSLPATLRDLTWLSAATQVFFCRTYVVAASLTWMSWVPPGIYGRRFWVPWCGPLSWVGFSPIPCRRLQHRPELAILCFPCVQWKEKGTSRTQVIWPSLDICLNMKLSHVPDSIANKRVIPQVWITDAVGV